MHIDLKRLCVILTVRTIYKHIDFDYFLNISAIEYL